MPGLFITGLIVFGWQHKLIWNWKSAYKWASMQFIALGATLQLALMAFPSEMREYLPDWLTHSLAIGCLAAAAYGRVTTRDPAAMAAPPPPKDQSNV